MADTIFMIHGMWGGPWYWEKYRGVFESQGYRCVATTLPYHDMDPFGSPDPRLGTIGLLGYAQALEQEVRRLGAKPILMGHSMGGLLAQMLGARGLARALVLLSPAPAAAGRAEGGLRQLRLRVGQGGVRDRLLVPGSAFRGEGGRVGGDLSRAGGRRRRGPHHPGIGHPPGGEEIRGGVDLQGIRPSRPLARGRAGLAGGRRVRRRLARRAAAGILRPRFAPRPARPRPRRRGSRCPPVWRCTSRRRRP